MDVAEPVVPVEKAPDPPQPEVAEVSPPQVDVVAATLVETKEESPAPGPKPPPLPKSPPPPERPVSVLGTIALLLFFLLGLFGAGGFALVWIATHLSAPLPVTSAPPLHAGNDRNFGKKKNDDREFLDQRKNVDVVKIEKRQVVVPEQIFVGPGFVNSRLLAEPWIDHAGWNKGGPYRLYKISLQEGKNYHFHISGQGLVPRLQIFDNGKVVAEREGVRPTNRVMLAFQPKRTADFLILVNAQEQGPGQFSLIVALENRLLPDLLDPPTEVIRFYRHHLRAEDPLDVAQQPFGPFREYEVTLQAGKDYAVGVQSPHFFPVLHVYDGPMDELAPSPDGSYRPRKTGKHRVLVSSRDYGLGDYTLLIGRLGERLQRVLVSLDGAGSFTDRREMTDRDPNREGFGQYKEYRVMFEEGKKYRIEMSLNDSPTALRLFDPDNRQIAEMKMKDATVVHEAERTGEYRIHAAAPARGEYTLRITTKP